MLLQFSCVKSNNAPLLDYIRIRVSFWNGRHSSQIEFPAVCNFPMPEKNIIPKMYCESRVVYAAYCQSQIFCQQLIFLNIKKQVTTIEFILSAQNVLSYKDAEIHTHTQSHR